MADLAKNRTRIGQQDRPVYRRDSILPTSRGPNDAPQRRGAIDVRAARRGDGGASEVLALARQVNGAFEDVQRYDMQKYVYDEQQNAFKAVADSELGQGPDEALMEESSAYKAAFSLSSMEGRMAEAKPRVLEKVQATIDGYQGADLVELMKSVDETMDAELRTLLTDEDGNLIDFGTAQAFAVAANRVGALTDQTRADARNVARKKIAENGTTAEVNRGLGMVRNNEILDIPQMFSTLKTYGLSDDEQRGALLKLVEIVDREDPAKAAAITSQLLGLPTDVKSIRAPGAVATKTELLAPTGKLPVAGRITSNIGDGRNHNGLDIDAKIGDPIEAPAGGRVIKVDRNPNQRAGIHVVIDHGNGVTSSYSHLDGAMVEVGDLIRPGQKFATVGNTGRVKKGPGGDGSHLHWVVREGSKLVNPLNFKFPEFQAEASVVELAKATQEPTAAPTLVIPEGLKFNPEQLALLSGMREQAIERQRVLADRAEKERYEQSAQELYTDLLNGSMPSDEKLRTMVASGRLDPDTAYNFKSLRESKIEAERARKERAQDRAEAEANRRADEAVAAIAMGWSVGEGPTSMAEFQSWARKNMGTLGTGANRLQNYNLLYGTVQRKMSLTTNNPEFKMYNGMVANLFGSSAGGVAGVRGGGADAKNIKLQAQLEFRRRVENNENPADAYLEVARKYGREAQAKAGSSLLMVEKDLSELEQRRQAAGIQ